ncbi:MAG: hypothetical protein KatS3mg027_2470 [Bacteroidia bacterium]|nr:MAG: hypothetical protein KatS3mg027_2470 [Bacteroidia bacterium]
MAVIFEVCMSNGMRGKSVVLSGILEKEVHPKMQDSWCLNDSLSNDSTKLGIKKNILFWDTFSPLILFSKFGVSYERFFVWKEKVFKFCDRLPTLPHKRVISRCKILFF